jgi:predicted dehydrogenase
VEKIRWGILGTAKISREHVIPAIVKSRLGTVTAIGSRDPARGKALAGEFGIPTFYGSYEGLLSDPNVDAIYNPLPNHLHVPISIRALEHGKHVLCEKPIGLSVAENQRDIGGGALMDIGCYGISLARFIFCAEPHRVSAMIERDPRSGVDRLVSAMLEFFQGTAAFTVGTQLAPYQRVHIVGTTGRIEIEIPFNAPADRPQRIWLQQGKEIEEIYFDDCDQYALQADKFAASILENLTVPTPLSDAVSNMRVIERVFASAEKHAWT